MDANFATNIQIMTSIAQAILAAGGLLFVGLELRRSSKLAKVQLIAQMNDRLSSFSDILPTVRTINGAEDWRALPEATRERVLDYISVFETIESMRQMRTLKSREIDYFFSGRFTDLVGRPGLQQGIFFNPEIGDQLYPIFTLHKSIVAARNKRGAGYSSAKDKLSSFANCDPGRYARLSKL